jgi:general secretion pathway protein C
LTTPTAHDVDDRIDSTGSTGNDEAMLAMLKRFLPTFTPDTLARWAVPVNLLLIAVLAQGLAQLGWRWFYSPPPTVGQVDVVDSATAPATSTTDYAAITNWHLFGKPEAAKPAAAPPAPARAPETRLNLRLVGMFFSDSGGPVLALIAEGNNPERPYRLGDTIANGPRLERILSDHVVLSRNGTLEKLSLPKDNLVGAAAPRAASPPTGGARPPAATPLSAVPAAPEAAAPVDASAVAERLRKQMETRPDALQDLAETTPYMQNGQFAGLRLRPGRDRQAFQQLGLQPGDVLTQVNGVPLTDPVQGLSLLQELLNNDQVNIQVLRNGTEVPLSFNLNPQ